LFAVKDEHWPELDSEGGKLRVPVRVLPGWD
jgi:hypothetical protein